MPEGEVPAIPKNKKDSQSNTLEDLFTAGEHRVYEYLHSHGGVTTSAQSTSGMSNRCKKPSSNIFVLKDGVRVN